MNRKPILLLILCLMALTLQAQELTVKELKAAPMDLSASQYRQEDSNGKACALLKVQMLDILDRVEGNTVEKPIRKGSETWIYLTEGTSNIKLFPRQHLPVEVQFSNYGIKGVEQLKVYILVLSEKRNSSNIPFSFGIRGGLNMSSTQFVEPYGNSSAVTSFHFGISADYQFSDYFGLDVAFLYSGKGYKYKKDQIDETASVSYITVPIHLSPRFKMSENAELQFHAGPYLAMAIGGTIKAASKGELKFTEKFNSFDYGLSFGAGALISDHFYLGAGYELGFARYRNRNLSISLGYNF